MNVVGHYEINPLKITKLAISRIPNGPFDFIMSLHIYSTGALIVNMMSLFPPRESLVSNILAGDGNIKKLFLRCISKILEEFLVGEEEYLGKLLPVHRNWCCGSGSGIRCLFDRWIRDPEWVESQHPDPGSGMNSPYHIF